VFALTWDDVDLDNKTLTIDKATVRKRIIANQALDIEILKDVNSKNF
jgi:hypothetical protein